MNKRYLRRLKYWQQQSGRGGFLSMVPQMWTQRRGQVDLNKPLVLPPLGIASEACRWESTCCGKKKAMGQLTNTGGEKSAELPEDSRKSLQPLMQHGEQQQNMGGLGVKTTFKPRLPSEGGGQQRSCQGLGCKGGRRMRQVDSSAQSFILERT